MTRGPKKHLKRLNAPKHWLLGKTEGIWAPKPSCGPHNGRECLPLVLIVRNRLKYALTKSEANMICMQKLVKVDGKVRTDLNFPAGFMDIVALEKSADQFRLLYNTKGRFVLHRVRDEEAKYKLCRVQKIEYAANKIPYLVTHDGRTIRYPDPLVKKNDSIKVDLETGKMTEIIKYQIGNLCMISKGRNTGRVGIIQHIERHPGSFDIVTTKDSAGNVFATRQANIFVLGHGNRPSISLPRGKGVKLTILEEKALREKRAANANN
jgi:ribosomal protein S4E